MFVDDRNNIYDLVVANGVPFDKYAAWVSRYPKYEIFENAKKKLKYI